MSEIYLGKPREYWEALQDYARAVGIDKLIEGTNRAESTITPGSPEGLEGKDLDGTNQPKIQFTGNKMFVDGVAVKEYAMTVRIV